MEVSPKYLMNLIDNIEKVIWEEFGSYKRVKNYIKKWHTSNHEPICNDFEENFIIYESNGNIDLNETLHNIVDLEIIIKMAIDLGINTPDFIPAIPLIKNNLKDNYSQAFDIFQKALNQIEENPDLAIGSANSTLESIIKYIIEDSKIVIDYDPKYTLYDLAQNILKIFSLYPNKQMPNEIRDIGSGLLKISKNIEKLRSEKTAFHGKSGNDYLIDDPLYAYFIVNTVGTLGLFLTSFYNKKLSKKNSVLQITQ